MLIAVYPACRYLGVAGGQVAALLAVLLGYVLQGVRVRRITGLNLLDYGRTFLPAALVSAGVLGVGLGANCLGLASTPTAHIAIGVGAGFIAYALSMPAFLRIKRAA